MGSFDRGFMLADMLHKGEIINTRKIMTRLKVSKATAKRDMNAIETLARVDVDVEKCGKVNLKLAH